MHSGSFGHIRIAVVAAPFGGYLVAIFADACSRTRSLKIALLALPASVIQICGYGTGFIKAYVDKIVLGHGRDIAREIEVRKGANEKL